MQHIICYNSVYINVLGRGDVPRTGLTKCGGIENALVMKTYMCIGMYAYMQDVHIYMCVHIYDVYII